MFTLGLAAFAAGSAACAAAPALGVLIAARAVQGLGASAMLPCSLALLVHQFPDPRARARALGVWGGMGSLGVALGPVAGGVLVTVAGWRSIFLVNVPICLLTIVLLRRYADESPKNPDRRADLPGLLLGVTMLAALTASFITAGQQGWLAPLPGALLGAGLRTAWLFLRAERRHPHPLLPLALFRSPNFSGATAVGMIFNLVLYGSLLCLSLYLQEVRHESVLATGPQAGRRDQLRRGVLGLDLGRAERRVGDLQHPGHGSRRLGQQEVAVLLAAQRPRAHRQAERGFRHPFGLLDRHLRHRQRAVSEEVDPGNRCISRVRGRRQSCLPCRRRRGAAARRAPRRARAAR